MSYLFFPWPPGCNNLYSVFSSALLVSFWLGFPEFSVMTVTLVTNAYLKHFCLTLLMYQDIHVAWQARLDAPWLTLLEVWVRLSVCSSASCVMLNVLLVRAFSLIQQSLLQTLSPTQNSSRVSQGASSLACQATFEHLYQSRHSKHHK